MLAGIVFCEMLSQYPQSAFQGSPRVAGGGSVAVCDPDPPRPFARFSLETFIACTEADFENRPCARENCAKLVRGAFPTDP